MSPLSIPGRQATALSVDRLRVQTESKVLVNDVSFSIGTGERVGLIGESGSGKSVTSLAVMGLLPENLRVQGSVHVGGGPRNIVGLSEYAVAGMRGADMSMVFQEPMTALNPLMRIGAQIAEAMVIHRNAATKAAARRKAVKLLFDVGLPDPAEAARAYPHQLSGGQRQRVVLAMALANDPALLVADEPTTALDVTVQRQVLNLVQRSVAERGTGLLFITHDLAVVGDICDRILVMHEGRIVEEGITEEVLTRPQHAYTRGLLAASDLEATDQEGRLFTVANASDYVPGRFVDRLGAASDGGGDGGGALDVNNTGGNEFSTCGDGAAREQLVSVQNLICTYQRGRSSVFSGTRTVHALDGISLDIAKGKRFGIVGESGSGKSTLLRILSGLERPTQGDVRVAGVDLASPSRRDLAMLRNNLQMVFQDPMASLDPRMKVADIIAEPLLNAANLSGTKLTRRERRARAMELLEQVGLPLGAMERFPHEFSGGQRQRISIARALSCKPKILLADEPVSALDVSVRAQVLNLLADLVDEYGLTLVFVSHDLGVVRYLCDEVAVMKRGHVVEQGNTEQIYEQPAHVYTQQLIASMPRVGRHGSSDG